MTNEIYDIAILGTGPIGLEAALRAAVDGYKTMVIERGEIAQNVSDWGHVKMFSPFEMNSSERGRDTVGESLDPQRCHRGDEFVENYLRPLAMHLSDRGVTFATQHEVIDIRREGWTKTSGVGETARSDSPFVIDCFSSSKEKTAFRMPPILSRALIDASGVFQKDRVPQRGNGFQGVDPFVDQLGMRGPLSATDRSTISATQRKRVLLVGAGYTAATDALNLANDGCHVTWLTRRGGLGPIQPVPDDPLPERQSLTERANALVTTGQVEWHGGMQKLDVSEAIEDPFGDAVHQGFSASVETSDGRRQWTNTNDLFDKLVLDVGHRPNTEIFRELHVHLCYATEGPIKLAAKLLGESSSDCLTQSGSDASLLVNPEPNFFILGAKSYGRNSNFLIRAGIEQVDAVFDELLPKTLWPLIGR